MNTQISLEDAINQLNIDEVKDALYEICLIVTNGVNDRLDTIEDDIIDVINQRIYKR